MTDPDAFDPDMTDLGRADWLSRLEAVSEEFGSALPLGEGHIASLVEDGRSLIVSFETLPHIRKTNPREEPRGWSFVRDSGWSALTILSLEDGWFRDPAIYAYFDSLIDDGFFDDFDEVLFHGTGAGGYAAAAYSVAAPGARVLALQPLATLDPRVTGWDTRFRDQRRGDFTSRFGFAPHMIEACERAWIVHDPCARLDAAHAALFHGPNVTHLRAPRMSSRMDRDFDQMGIMEDLIEAAMEGVLDETIFARLWRARQRHLPYLRTTLQTLERSERFGLAARLCRDVAGRTGRPMFQRKLDDYTKRGLLPDPPNPKAKGHAKGQAGSRPEPEGFLLERALVQGRLRARDEAGQKIADHPT